MFYAMNEAEWSETLNKIANGDIELEAMLLNHLHMRFFCAESVAEGKEAKKKREEERKLWGDYFNLESAESAESTEKPQPMAWQNSDVLEQKLQQLKPGTSQYTKLLVVKAILLFESEEYEEAILPLRAALQENHPLAKVVRGYMYFFGIKYENTDELFATNVIAARQEWQESDNIHGKYALLYTKPSSELKEEDFQAYEQLHASKFGPASYQLGLKRYDYSPEKLDLKLKYMVIAYKLCKTSFLNLDSDSILKHITSSSRVVNSGQLDKFENKYWITAWQAAKTRAITKTNYLTENEKALIKENSALFAQMVISDVSLSQEERVEYLKFIDDNNLMFYFSAHLTFQFHCATGLLNSLINTSSSFFNVVPRELLGRTLQGFADEPSKDPTPKNTR